MKTEADKIFERYEKRNESEKIKKLDKHYIYNNYVRKEREIIYTEILRRKFKSFSHLKFLEVGAGSGINLNLFKNIGLNWDNIYVNELLPDRFKKLIESFPQIQAFKGDICDFSSEFINSFDIIMQSLVFTSILDYDYKKKMADKMWSLLKPGGIVLWYDFMYNNPQNQDVRGIKKKEIALLFSKAKKISFYKTTLAPPIGRKIKKLYPIISIIPLLRTHVIAEIEK